MRNKNGTEYDQKWLKHQHDNMFSQFACGLGYPPLWIHAYSISCASVNAFQCVAQWDLLSFSCTTGRLSDRSCDHFWQNQYSTLKRIIFLCPAIMSFQGGSFVCIFNLFLLNNELWLLTQIVVATINNQLRKLVFVCFLI